MRERKFRYCKIFFHKKTKRLLFLVGSVLALLLVVREAGLIKTLEKNLPWEVTDKNGVRLTMVKSMFENNNLVFEPVLFRLKNNFRLPIYFWKGCGAESIRVEKRMSVTGWYAQDVGTGGNCWSEPELVKLNPGETTELSWDQGSQAETGLAEQGIYRFGFSYALNKPKKGRQPTKEGKNEIFTRPWRIIKSEKNLETTEKICAANDAVSGIGGQENEEDWCGQKMLAEYKDEIAEKYCYEYLVMPYAEEFGEGNDSGAGVYIFAAEEKATCLNDIQTRVEKKKDGYEIFLGWAKAGSSCQFESGEWKSNNIPSVKVPLGKLASGDYQLTIRTCGKSDRFNLNISADRYKLEEVETAAGRVDPESGGKYTL